MLGQVNPNTAKAAIVSCGAVRSVPSSQTTIVSSRRWGVRYELCRALLNAWGWSGILTSAQGTLGIGVQDRFEESSHVRNELRFPALDKAQHLDQCRPCRLMYLSQRLLQAI